jgi:hypothetical protein
MMVTTAAGARTMVKRVAPRAAAVRPFLVAEKRSRVAFSRPHLLLRGYLSSRAWMYGVDPTRTPGYVADLDYESVVGRLNPLAVQTAFTDKLAFAQALEAHGLATHAPALLGVVRDGAFEAHADDPGGPVALKLIDGSRGRGFRIHPDLASALEQAPSTGTYLVQPRVRGHAYGAEMFPGALNSLRIAALRHRPGGEAHVVAVAHRIGTSATAPTDGNAEGGLVARVLDDGTMTSALGPIVARRRDEHDVHPETGAQIAGRRVPHLAEAVDLVLAAMDRWPDAAYIGWDVAISETGPVLLEGNAAWPSVAMVQTHGTFADRGEARQFFLARRLLPER